MSVLILQIVIKQWDKSQRTDAHIKHRASIADKYPLIFPPAFYAFDKQCVIDQHGDDIQGNRLKYAQTANGKINFDRFQICLDNKAIAYLGAKPGDTPRIIASLKNQWIQCKYENRYSIFESNMFYWLYEEVTVNTIYVSEFNANIFLENEAMIVHVDKLSEP